MRYSVGRWIRMHKDHRLAALKLFEDRLQSGVSQVDAPGVREENKTIEFEDVDCVRQLFERGIDVRQRKASETCKPVRSSMNEIIASLDHCSGASPPTGTCESFVSRQKKSGNMW